MYICKRCGKTFDEPVRKKAYLGRWGEQDVYEDCYSSPCCDTDFENALKCEKCGKWHYEDELNGGVCDGCVNEYRHDFVSCYEIAKKERVESVVSLNSVVASVLAADEINEILRSYIQERMPDIDCSLFIDDDISWFGEQIAEREEVE